MHDIRTGVCILDSSGAESELFSVHSQVEFGQLSDELIKQYIATGEPMYWIEWGQQAWPTPKFPLRNRAGAYAIQAKGAVLVKTVRGSFSNVVGLPIYEVAQKLRKMLGEAE